ncbi:DUF6078 family protein [Porphyromonas uenonis]|uniref:DUF6078 family protein n=1 Tax=Porphyromonas uenonis TaxID=281920 RepID=UPI001EE2399C|nr:DUF6078 family protein [Porphyromonas uenonis]
MHQTRALYPLAQCTRGGRARQWLAHHHQSPAHRAAGGYDHCPNYYEHKLRRYARGLVWSYDDLTLAQWRQIQTQLNRQFGYSEMKRIRHGYVALSPEEQGVIAQIFTTIAPGSEPQYVTYEEHYTKPPRIEGRAAHKLLKG